MVGFSLMRQYIPCGKVSENMYSEINRKVSFKEYKRAKTALFNSNIEYGYLQDGAAASKEFIPAFDGTGVVKK
jgi:putative pyruvate formate lyase activating enzyme